MIFLFFAGLITGLMLWSVSYIVLGLLKFYNLNENEGITIFVGVVGFLGFAFGFSALMCLSIGEGLNIGYIIGGVLGIVLSVLYTIYVITCANGQYHIIEYKIKKIEKTIEKLSKENDLKANQKQAIKILEDTKKSLKEQAHDILILDSIKVAREIASTNNNFNVQEELDKLEALQILKG